MGHSTDIEQTWFGTRRWQEGEREADEDIRVGRVHSFDNAEDAIAYLHKRAERRHEKRGSI